MLGNRRKSCALISQNAHNGTPRVRIKALTNKAAHNKWNDVRTASCAVRVLTSISIATTCDFCREIGGAAGVLTGEVRKSAHYCEQGG